MGDEAAQHRVSVLHIAEVAGAVQAVQPCPGQLGEVADVVQPRGRLEELFIGTEGGLEAACAGGHALDVRPAPGKRLLQEVAGEDFGPGGKGVHNLRLRTQPGTFTDVMCRLETSETPLEFSCVTHSTASTGSTADTPGRS